MKVPADVYVRSPRVYRGLEELTYPFHDQTIMVTRCGRICFRGAQGEPQSCLRWPESSA
jgi:putative transposase